MSQSQIATATGLATYAADVLLDVWYPQPALGDKAAHVTGLERGIDTDALRGVRVEVITTTSDLAAAPKDAADAYLRLHLLSHRLMAPRTINLDGLFGLLTNVAWTSLGPVAVENVTQVAINARAKGIQLNVFGLDKFPRMLDYVVPSGVRIADADRVRLGAHLAAGTTVMHEGFINFNAGTAGPGMIEGRVSAGVFVGKGSDLGGGCSTMGTLSGGGNIVISLGEGCLIGANAGIGIPLGDRNTVESGLYITAGTKVALLDADNQLVKVLKARELAGQPDLLFRRNSQTGAVECKTHKSAIELNEALHAHN